MKLRLSTSLSTCHLITSVGETITINIRRKNLTKNHFHCYLSSSLNYFEKITSINSHST